MTEKLADILKNKINDASLSWTDLIGGLAFPIERQQRKDDDPTFSIFPAGTEVIGGQTVTGWNHQSLVPAKRYKSVIFFEEDGTSINTNERSNHTSTLRLVCWLNLKAIGESDNSNRKTDDYAIELINLLKDSQGSSGNFNGMFIEFSGVPKRDKDIWSNYTFDQDQSQFLTFPYSYFALDFTVTYFYNHAC